MGCGGERGLPGGGGGPLSGRRGVLVRGAELGDAQGDAGDPAPGEAERGEGDPAETEAEAVGRQRRRRGGAARAQAVGRQGPARLPPQTLASLINS